MHSGFGSSGQRRAEQSRVISSEQMFDAIVDLQRSVDQLSRGHETIQSDLTAIREALEAQQDER